MKISIIGANSYIARNLIYVLKAKRPDDRIYLYDLTDKHIDDVENYQRISVLDRKSVSQIEFDSDLIFMFVGKTGSFNGFDDYETFINVNERALLNVLDEYRKRDSKAKLIFPSSRLVYKGKSGTLKEDSEKEFKTIYAINKFSCEQYLEQYHNVFGLRYLIFRICLPYGSLIPGASSYGTAEFMLNKAKNGENISLYGDGENRRTLTYIGDLCNILIEGSLCPGCVNDIFNIGGENYSLKEMADLIAEHYGVQVDHCPWPDNARKIESGDTVFDDAKLKSVCHIKYDQKFADWCKTAL